MQSNIQNRPQAAQRSGFTLIEVLTVITIIAILAALLVPAVQGVIAKGKRTAIEIEIQGLSQALEEYANRYGDYPPDYSDLNTAIRHFRRAFPQIATEEIGLITSLCSDANGSFNPTAINRAEALVLAVRGYSSDKTHPLTGNGGPLQVINPAAPLSRLNVRFNPDTENKLFDVDLGRLRQDGHPEVAADELPILVPSGLKQPYLYFDSRTYGIVGTTASGAPLGNGYYAGATAGGVRPYLSNVSPKGPTGATYGTAAAAMNAFRFQNADKFQIISAGLDDVYGSLIATDMTNPGDSAPVYFIAETGVPISPDPNASSPAALQFMTMNGFQDSEFSQDNVNGQFDNQTSFFRGTLESNLP